MTPEQMHRASIKALALGERDTADELRKRFSESDHRLSVLYMYGVTCVVLRYRFGEEEDGLDFTELQRFIAEMRHDYRNAEPPLEYLNIEAVIRAPYGEEYLLDEMNWREKYFSFYRVLRQLVERRPDIKEDLDQIITRTQKLIEHWICTPGSNL
ncbi:hypothetical protein L0U85_13380 [Glycomyces sp. L485]|uniref:hypothetical protein n=1 Tax=Glycomyces sp. L485 TaxID=2909235 RepID=UPI001F4B6940|nr:hypothetical protein [Glycomyces sp. L485]MCH7231837.1 hypothetical protein [Glycomyces sp. L485]